MSNADELFEAFGFKKIEDGLWRFYKDFTDDPEATEQPDRSAILIIEERGDGVYVGHVPFVTFASSDLNAVPERSLCFTSTDPRDMVALAQSEVASAYSQATGMFVDEGFEDNDDDIFITMPFMSDPWGDYQMAKTARPDDKHAELADPSGIFRRYVGWRDEFCQKLLSKSPSARSV